METFPKILAQMGFWSPSIHYVSSFNSVPNFRLPLRYIYYIFSKSLVLLAISLFQHDSAVLLIKSLIGTHQACLSPNVQDKFASNFNDMVSKRRYDKNLIKKAIVDMLKVNKKHNLVNLGLAKNSVHYTVLHFIDIHRSQI